MPPSSTGRNSLHLAHHWHIAFQSPSSRENSSSGRALFARRGEDTDDYEEEEKPEEEEEGAGAGTGPHSAPAGLGVGLDAAALEDTGRSPASSHAEEQPRSGRRVGGVGRIVNRNRVCSEKGHCFYMFVSRCLFTRGRVMLIDSMKL